MYTHTKRNTHMQTQHKHTHAYKHAHTQLTWRCGRWQGEVTWSLEDTSPWVSEEHNKRPVSWNILNGGGREGEGPHIVWPLTNKAKPHPHMSNHTHICPATPTYLCQHEYVGTYWLNSGRYSRVKHLAVFRLSALCKISFHGNTHDMRHSAKESYVLPISECLHPQTFPAIRYLFQSTCRTSHIDLCVEVCMEVCIEVCIEVCDVYVVCGGACGGMYGGVWCVCGVWRCVWCVEVCVNSQVSWFLECPLIWLSYAGSTPWAIENASQHSLPPSTSSTTSYPYHHLPYTLTTPSPYQPGCCSKWQSLSMHWHLYVEDKWCVCVCVCACVHQSIK